MQSFINMLSFYAQSHQKCVTKVTHFIGVPMIILAVQIFLNLFHVYHISYAWIILIPLIAYYLLLDKQLAVITGLFLILITWAAQVIYAHQPIFSSVILAGGLFILGWIFQFIGHYFEEKPPAFLSNLFQMFMAPIFLVTEICFMFGYRDDLKKVLRIA